MKDPEDSSSNDEAPAAYGRESDNEISALLLDVVERLTKIAVICESPCTADSSSVKSLMKHIYKFEKALKKLQNIAKQDRDRSYPVFKGALSAVDNYLNPYDWAKINIVNKYRDSGRTLDAALDAVDVG
ncbi:uncharacterized protein BXIN_0150 [Babesia sp. Xinjiang]|uniref:uncharacterized protein n=1 Tax=Babesia sp. Xinjiang TaxID=462227 RepID=UPI000A2395DA|nr:uncharacterized protein BXIN_0150 [Babesia sp. Xinjiang]ORM39763.1 hypothetical protein BXIN_0150 [Babesia sp. Xinjiang]